MEWRAARRGDGRGGRMTALHFPRPHRAIAAFSTRGAPAPSPHQPGNRASFVSVRLSRRATTTPASRALRSRTCARCTYRTNTARAAKIVSSWPGALGPGEIQCRAAPCCWRWCCWRWRRRGPEPRAATRPTCARTSPRAAPPAPPVSARGAHAAPHTAHST